MKTLVLEDEIGLDGKLSLEIDCGLPAGPADVVIVVQPRTAGVPPPYDALTGLFAGQLPLDADVEADLKLISRDWQHRLELPQ